MRKGFKRWTTILIILIILVIAAFAYSASSIDWIKGEELIDTSVSPNGNYTMLIYRNNGGATVPYSFLGVIKNNTTGTERNFFWDSRVDYGYCVLATWEDENTVRIGGRKINVETEKYDYRNT